MERFGKNGISFYSTGLPKYFVNFIFPELSVAKKKAKAFSAQLSSVPSMAWRGERTTMGKTRDVFTIL